MTYEVTAPLVLARDKEGKTHHRYEGTRIDWLSDEQAQHLIVEGMVKEVDGSDQPGDDDQLPDESWTRAQIDAWAAENLEIDTSGVGNKADALAAIAEHLDES